MISYTSLCSRLEVVEQLTSPTQCRLPGKLIRPALYLRLLGIALPVCVEFRLKFGKFCLKLIEICEGGIAFCLERAVSESETNRMGPRVVQ